MSEDKPNADVGSEASASPAADAPVAHGLQPTPLDLLSPQFTLRAVLTGMVLAALFSACNIYLGLKIGFSLNMSITAALVAYAFWMGARGAFGVRKWGILENNINQTACSSGASVASAGLVAPIPALALLTGQTLDWHYLALWVFSVCLVGITVAIGLRRQMLLVDKLPFAVGIASAETLRELYAKGSEGLKRVAVLGAAALMASPILWLSQFKLPLVGWGLPRAFTLGFSLKGFTARSLTFGIDSTLLMYALGGLVGLRICVSLLVGGLLGWAVLAPNLIHSRHLRLAVFEPLAALPESVQLALEPEGFASYDANKHRLIWKGVMSRAERDALLAQSNDALYRAAVEKLCLRSRLRLSAPLAALPEGVTLPDDAAVAFDAEAQALVARRGLDRDTRDRLRGLSDAPAYRAALDELSAHFAYTTIRLVQTSTTLKALPAGFAIPRQLGALVRYDQERRALIAFGRLSEAALAELSESAGALARQRHDQSPACEALVAALAALHARSGESILPLGVEIPPELADLISYDAATQTLRATGILTEADRKRLLSLVAQDSPGYRDYAATIGALVAGARFRGATPNYKDIVTWLLWPGVTLMVVASLTSLAFSGRSILKTFTRGKQPGAGATPVDTGEVTRRWFVTGLLAALILSVVLQLSFFQIVWWAAVGGVLLSFVLAIVAGRVSGETGITPVAPVGKVSQVVFGALLPAQPAPNLMAANVTGGAASQCADLLHDLKCGHLLGASARLQSLAQVCGALAGALAGSAVYLILIPNPAEQLITDEWAAPGVAGMKAVAELFKVGFAAIPSGTPLAMLIASLAAVVLAVAEKVVPKKARRFMLSPVSIGLALVIPAHTSLTMFVGAAAALLLSKLFKSWTTRFLVAICAGIVAGESITGVGISLYKIVAT